MYVGRDCKRDGYISGSESVSICLFNTYFYFLICHFRNNSFFIVKLIVQNFHFFPFEFELVRIKTSTKVKNY